MRSVDVLVGVVIKVDSDVVNRIRATGVRAIAAAALDDQENTIIVMLDGIHNHSERCVDGNVGIRGHGLLICVAEFRAFGVHGDWLEDDG